jgi:hypothetical protein
MSTPPTVATRSIARVSGWRGMLLMIQRDGSNTHGVTAVGTRECLLWQRASLLRRYGRYERTDRTPCAAVKCGVFSNVQTTSAIAPGCESSGAPSARLRR